MGFEEKRPLLGTFFIRIITQYVKQIPQFLQIITKLIIEHDQIPDSRIDAPYDNA